MQILATAADYSASPSGYVNTILLLVITIGLGMVGYWVHRQDRRTDLLETTVNALNTTVAVLDNTVGTLREQVRINH